MIAYYLHTYIGNFFVAITDDAYFELLTTRTMQKYVILVMPSMIANENKLSNYDCCQQKTSPCQIFLSDHKVQLYFFLQIQLFVLLHNDIRISKFPILDNIVMIKLSQGRKSIIKMVFVGIFLLLF